MKRRMPAVFFFIGSILAFTSVYNRPQFESCRTVDVLPIFASGMLCSLGLASAFGAFKPGE